MISFKNISDLDADVASWLPHVSSDIDVVVGIPRSGMMAASLLALHLHKPMTDLGSYLEGRLIESGKRLDQDREISLDDPSLSILVVDDTVRTGSEMQSAKERISAHAPSNTITYGAVYVKPGSESIVDTYYETVPTPRVFEWNVMNHVILWESCVDIDGVLCKEPTDEENDDGVAYREFLRTVEPMYCPEEKIKCVVTNRLEKYRGLTEEWLKRHDIDYGELIMMDEPSAQARRDANRYIEHKSEAYMASGAELFIESSKWQAEGIANTTGQQVYCVDTKEMIHPSRVAEFRKRSRDNLARIMQAVVKAVNDPLSVPSRIALKLQNELFQARSHND